MNLGSVDISQTGRDVVSFSPVTGDSPTCRLCLLYLSPLTRSKASTTKSKRGKGVIRTSSLERYISKLVNRSRGGSSKAGSTTSHYA